MHHIIQNELIVIDTHIGARSLGQDQLDQCLSCPRQAMLCSVTWVMLLKANPIECPWLITFMRSIFIEEHGKHYLHVPRQLSRCIPSTQRAAIGLMQDI